MSFSVYCSKLSRCFILRESSLHINNSKILHNVFLTRESKHTLTVTWSLFALTVNSGVFPGLPNLFVFLKTLTEHWLIQSDNFFYNVHVLSLSRQAGIEPTESQQNPEARNNICQQEGCVCVCVCMHGYATFCLKFIEPQLDMGSSLRYLCSRDMKMYFLSAEMCSYL